MSHVEKCRNLYYATLKVPEALRVKLGRTKFKQSLGTGDKRRAQELAKPVVALWKAQLRQATGEPNAVQAEALRWRAAIKAIREVEGEGDQLDTLGLLLTDAAERIAEKHGDTEGERFAEVALGQRTPSRLHYDAWAASIVHLAEKTQDQYKADVLSLTAHFANLEDMTPEAMRDWVRHLATEAGGGASPASIKRMVSCWRSYWTFLEGERHAPEGLKPFALIKTPKKPKAAGRGGWVPFAAADVPKLAAEAQQRGDGQLADLITLGAYTGARIEELCSLEWKDIGADSFRITDSKTDAGVREVPIHPSLRPVLKALKKEAADSYVLGGLTFNKYNDRSNAIGKRFGRLKAALGYGEQHVFHSLRKTVVTLMEDAGVSENLAADIVGHEKPRITYGLYSGGASLPTKAKALAKVKYSARVGRAAI